MPQQKPPPPKKMPADYYNQKIDGQDALVLKPPPMPGAPTTGPNLLSMYVPSENTEVDMGAGKTPGIRMATDNHAHITARTPLTTISLGSPGGDGISKGDPPGIQVFTEGAKRETVEGSTEEWHKDTKSEYVKGVWNVRCEDSKTEYVKGVWDLTCEDSKTEYVKGVWNQTCDNAKTETVAGTVTEHYKAEHNLTVHKPAVYAYGSHKKETIGGNLNLHVKGHRAEHIDGDCSWIKGGTSHEVFVGEKTSITAAVTTALALGPSIAVSTVKVARTDVSIDKTGVKHSQVDIDFEKRKAKLTSGQIKLIDAVMTIIK